MVDQKPRRESRKMRNDYSSVENTVLLFVKQMQFLPEFNDTFPEESHQSFLKLPKQKDPRQTKKLLMILGDLDGCK